MNTLSAIAIDDEPSALDIISIHAKQIPFLELVQTFTSPTEAINFLTNHSVDVIFLDIEMPDMQGTDLAKVLNNDSTEIIFITAHEKYALEGYEIQVSDYLLKPVTFDRFLKCCKNALNKKKTVSTSKDFIFVKDGYDLVKIMLNEILYIKSDTNLLFIYTDTDRVVTRMTITRVLEILPKENFLRVHKSYIVAVSSISKLDKQFIYIGNTQIQVSAAYRKAVQDKIKLYLKG